MIENNKQNSFAVHSFAFKQLHQCKYLQTSLVNISFSTLSLLLNKNNNKEIDKQPEITTPRNKQCVKSVQIRSFFWSVFSCIRTEYGPEKSSCWTLFYSVSPAAALQNCSEKKTHKNSRY